MRPSWEQHAPASERIPEEDMETKCKFWRRPHVGKRAPFWAAEQPGRRFTRMQRRKISLLQSRIQAEMGEGDKRSAGRARQRQFE